MEYIVDTKGRLDAKLIVTDENGNDTWMPFDTRTATEEPNGKILVFNTVLGVYEQADNLEHAREMFKKHIETWTFPVGTQFSDEKMQAMADALKADGKNVSPFVMTINKVKNDS